MDFKKLMNTIVLTILFLSLVSCQLKNKSQKTEQTKNRDRFSVKKDSIVFRTSNEKFTYLAERVYPSAELSDSMTIVQLIQSDILSIEKAGDTLFVFLNNEMLSDRQNKYLPPLSDSLIHNFYPKFYDVVVDDDIPYFVYFKSLKDDITLIKERQSGIFSWTSALIKDTILSFSGIKPGVEKEEVFAHLGFPEFEFNKDEFSIILCHASIPSEVWFKPILKSQKALKSYGFEGCKLETDKPQIQILLNFKDDKLEYLYIDPWIGYGKKAKSAL